MLRNPPLRQAPKRYAALMEDNFQQLDKIILESIEVGNELESKLVSSNNYFLYAEGLGKKILNHVVTARMLSNGSQIKVGNKSSELSIDFASMIILARAALESYLVFNHIFVTSKEESIREFRFKCWDLAGYIERASFTTYDEKSSQIKEKERIKIEELKSWFESNEIFTALPQKHKEKLMGGNWRIDKSWTDLAVISGFNKAFFSQRYSFLCGYSHSGRLSVLQIMQAKDLNSQKEMAEATIQILMMALAKYVHDYVFTIPELEHVRKKMSQYKTIVGWKIIAETI